MRFPSFVAIALAAVAPLGGCALLSGVGDLEVVGTGDGADATAPPNGDGGLTVVDGGFLLPDGRVTTDASGFLDSPFTSGDAQGDTSQPGIDSGPSVSCKPPAQVTGTYTPCVQSGATFAAPSCVEYCQSLGRCCAENCFPFSTDHSVQAAEFDDKDLEHCEDPLNPGGDSHGDPTCSDSPIPPNRSVKCCCGPP